MGLEVVMDVLTGQELEPDSPKIMMRMIIIPSPQ